MTTLFKNKDLTLNKMNVNEAIQILKNHVDENYELYFQYDKIFSDGLFVV